ncbi:MAG: hypothetical protein WCP18_03485 [bacterium]
MKKIVRVVGIRKIEGDRIVVSGVGKNYSNQQDNDPYNFARLGGGHGEYTMGRKLMLHIIDGDKQIEIDVSRQFRNKLGRCLTIKCIKAIICVQPDLVEIELEEGHWQVTDDTIADWVIMANIK